MDKTDITFFGLVMIMVGFLIGGFFVDTLNKHEIRKELIEKNVAHWSIDSKTGKRAFISPYKFTGCTVEKQ